MKALYGMWASVNVSECDEKHSCVPHVTWSTCLKNGTCGRSECKPLNELSQTCTLCTFAKIMMPPKTWHMNVDLFLQFTGGKDTGTSTHTHACTHTCTHTHTRAHTHSHMLSDMFESLWHLSERMNMNLSPSCQLIIIFIPIIGWRPVCVFRDGSWWKHTYTIMHAYKCTCTCDEI